MTPWPMPKEAKDETYRAGRWDRRGWSIFVNSRILVESLWYILNFYRVVGKLGFGFGVACFPPN